MWLHGWCVFLARCRVSGGSKCNVSPLAGNRAVEGSGSRSLSVAAATATGPVRFDLRGLRAGDREPVKGMRGVGVKAPLQRPLEQETPGSDSGKNFNSKAEPKGCYELKMPPALPVPALNIDSDNYMLTGTRQRSFSFTHGTHKCSAPASPSQHHVKKSPLDLDMFCVRQTVNSIASVYSSSDYAKPPTLSTTSNPLNIPQFPNCARVLNYHYLLCSCQLSCCCMCYSLCPSDCFACLHTVCLKYALNYPCQKNKDILPPVTHTKDTVSPFSVTSVVLSSSDCEHFISYHCVGTAIRIWSTPYVGQHDQLQLV